MVKSGTVLPALVVVGAGLLWGCHREADPAPASPPPSLSSSPFSTQSSADGSPLATPQKLPPVPFTRSDMPPNAPKDRPVSVNSTMQDHILALSTEARKSLPKVERRFHAGLPKGQTLFVTTLVHDTNGGKEMVFVQVLLWKKGQIVGGVTTETQRVKSIKFGDMLTVPESQVMDWGISRPDGTEEGNIVGKYIDTQAQ